MPLDQGSILHGRYQIADILGQGGMGSVYRAIDQNLGVEVAVKENLFTTDEYARQFRLEAVILASLRQTNMPRVTDHFVIGHEGQYLVMDYIEGEDLRQRMGTIPEEEAILIGAAICDALSYLHTRKPPVLHRDIKPGNVKITPEGHVYLVDFGLAKVMRGTEATTTGARAMTPGYSPPEQYGTARTDPRSDVYSLGATLYAALTGIIPEDGLARVMDNTELTPVRKRNPRVSRKLAAAIEKAMEPFPDDRFQSADEFKQALTSASSRTQKLNGAAVSPAPAGTDRPASKPLEDFIPAESVSEGASKARNKRKRNPKSLGWLAFLLLFALILIVGVGFVLNNPGILPASLATYIPAGFLPRQTATATQTASPTIPPATATSEATATDNSPISTVTKGPSPTNSPVPTATPTKGPTLTPTLVPTPIGGGPGDIAFASDRSGIPQIYIMKADGSDQRAITNESDGACEPDWSPDGTKLVYISPCTGRKDIHEGSTLFVINADGSNKVALPASTEGEFDPTWSPDGKAIAFTSMRDGFPQIYVLNLETNEVTRLTETTSDINTRQPAWSPDGTQIVYTVKRFGVLQIWTMTATGKAQDQLVRSGSNYSDFGPVWSPDQQTVFFSQMAVSGGAARLMGIRYEERLTRKASQVTTPPPVVDIDFAPDGFWLVFESSNGQNQDIYVMTISGGDRMALTSDPGVDFDPAWRPILAP